MHSSSSAHRFARPAYVVVAMPAYAEEGLAEFVAEIRAVLRPSVRRLGFVVVDDCSPTPVDPGPPPADGPDVVVLRNPENLGHGPSVRRAYDAALASGADAVVHVDGDGQFHGADVHAVLRSLATADVVHGRRVGRSDPWYRAAVTGALRGLVALAAPGLQDPNCPLRAYRRSALEHLLPLVGEDPLVPHVHLSVLAARRPLRVCTVEVRSRPRRGTSEVGTMWSGSRTARWLPPRRLVGFCAAAVREVAGAALTLRWAPPAQAGPQSPGDHARPATPEAA